MNLLYKGFGDAGLGTAVEVDGKMYPINYQYYYIIKIISILENARLDNQKRLTHVLQYFYAEEVPEDLVKALEKCFEFIKAGNYQIKSRRKAEHSEAVAMYDFDQDHQIIFASMCQAYGEAWYEWHWWRWKAAFDHLPDTSPIKQIISIRARKIDAKMSPQEKAHIRELKEMYSLEKVEEAELTAAELEAKIMAS